jgi:hypothetical protein
MVTNHLTINKMSKQKLNFATRVKVALTPKTDTSNGYSNERMRLNAEINSRKIDLDSSVFMKTPAEKLEVKLAKLKWKSSNR